MSVLLDSRGATRRWGTGFCRPSSSSLREGRERGNAGLLVSPCAAHASSRPAACQQRKSRDSLGESRLFQLDVFHDGPQSSPGRAFRLVCRPVSPACGCRLCTWFAARRHLAAQKLRIRI